jgi:hypothetical protein
MCGNIKFGMYNVNVSANSVRNIPCNSAITKYNDGVNIGGILPLSPPPQWLDSPLGA